LPKEARGDPPLEQRASGGKHVSKRDGRVWQKRSLTTVVGAAVVEKTHFFEEDPAAFEVAQRAEAVNVSSSSV
jgi:hypothetical protein